MSLKTVNTPDKNLQLVQDNVSEALMPLQLAPLTGGNMLTSISLISGQDNLVAHLLAKTPKFFIVTNIDTDTNVWSAPSPQLSNTSATVKFINLLTTTTCIVSLWVN